ncbi:quinoprotein relay system zinc metallohydrolase 2 [Hyphomicrobium sp. 99]|uniref:quinoprotein relay system zinc metallohydrolase 2 n=1 Tax=Hyphomicrobium sp. 99 TaxID=1163419 RepID=UPI0005F85D7E|nr:quinoprotein relay system zinc metallohydrolase 2 [Hyphomicrobium sp. 99]
MTGIPPYGAKPSRKDFLRGATLAALLPLLPRVSRAEAERIGVLEIAPGIFVHVGKYELVNRENRGDISNAVCIIGANAVAVIDTSGSYAAGKDLLEAIAEITSKPIHYVINTHMHPDHVMGNAAFKSQEVQFVGHHKLPAALYARKESYLTNARERVGDTAFAGTEIIPPTLLVKDTLDLDLGGRTLTLKARPTAHTDNDLTIFDSATGTFFLGDLLFSNHVPTLDGSIVGWLNLIPVLTQEKADRAVPGHGPKTMPWPDAIAPVERYLKVLASDVRKMIKDGKTIEEAVATAGQSERGKWALFDEHHPRNVTAAFTELEWE